MRGIVKILVMAALLSPLPGFMARAAEINIAPIIILLLGPEEGSLVPTAEVNLLPSDPVVEVGDTFSVHITISLNQETGEQLAGGIINLGYDDGVVEILEVAIDPYWNFLPDPGSKTEPGRWEGIGFDVFDTPPATGNVVIACVTLEALEAGTSMLEVLASSQFFRATAEFFPIIWDASIHVNTRPVGDD